MCEMESYTYDFAYKFTIIYFQTFYEFLSTAPIQAKDELVVMLENAELKKGVPSCSVLTESAGLKVFVDVAPLSSESIYISAVDRKRLKEQIIMILQVAHKKQMDGIVLHVSGTFELESVATLLQMALYEYKGIFRYIVFAFENAKTQEMYRRVFGIA